MLNLSSLLLVSFLSVQGALAAEFDVKAEEKALASVSKWSDLSRGLEAHLPTNVVKEFRLLAEEEHLPRVLKTRFGLQIRGDSGGQIKVKLLEGGGVEFNGESWKIRPLASVKSEIERIASLMQARETRAFLDLLIPSAFASGVSEQDRFGPAAAAFAAAYGWQAKFCAGGNLTESKLKECLLMAAPMEMAGGRQIVPANDGPDARKRFIPVDLQCPRGRTGNLTLIMKNYSGESVRIRVEFKGGSPEESTYDFARRGESYQNMGRFIPASGGNQYGERAQLLGNSVFVDVCEGSQDTRDRYMAKLSSNAESIRSQSARGPDAPEVAPSGSSAT